MVTQNAPIFPAATAIDTFRNSGYKNTASALAELIDNSIEAGAKNIQILTFEEAAYHNRRTSYKIAKIAVYDDGNGMTPETLQLSLQFGAGTRMNTRRGMGRFGIGLPNASVSQCKKVTVYSWQNNGQNNGQNHSCYKNYLDVDEIKRDKLQEAKPVIECELPIDELKKYAEISDKNSGTLVVWEKCDRLDRAKSSTLFKEMEKGLCRIYRHFLVDNSDYGKVNISLISVREDKDETKVQVLKANDPLYLLTPNNVPGYENEKTNVEQKPAEFEVEYGAEGKKSKVEIRFSIARPEIQNLGGNSLVGKHYQKNTGISFVRARREIDFGDFGFLTNSEPRERWWGCEVRFEPVLDELFGVTNNKQSIVGIKKLNLDEFEEQEIEDNPKLSLRRELSKKISNNLKSLMATITSRREGIRQKKTATSKINSTKIANEVFSSQKQTKSHTHILGDSKSKEQKEQEWKERLEKDESFLTLSLDEKFKIIQEKVKSEIDIDFDSWPGEQFFCVNTAGETAVVTINKSHPFYIDLYDPLNEDLKDAIDLLIFAFARTQEERYSYSEDFGRISSIWGGYVRDLLGELKKNA